MERCWNVTWGNGKKWVALPHRGRIICEVTLPDNQEKRGIMDKRVQFDFEIEFTNGGGIQGQGFRLDIAGDTISDRELADYIVQDMRLLMVGRVQILNKRIIEEEHKRRAINETGPQRVVDLSHTIEH